MESTLIFPDVVLVLIFLCVLCNKFIGILYTNLINILHSSLDNNKKKVIKKKSSHAITCEGNIKAMDWGKYLLFLSLKRKSKFPMERSKHLMLMDCDKVKKYEENNRLKHKRVK